MKDSQKNEVDLKKKRYLTHQINFFMKHSNGELINLLKILLSKLPTSLIKSLIAFDSSAVIEINIFFTLHIFL